MMTWKTRIKMMVRTLKTIRHNMQGYGVRVAMVKSHMHDIEPILLQPYQGFYEDTFAYKLTFRTDTIKEIDGKQTYYGWIVSNR